MALPGSVAKMTDIEAGPAEAGTPEPPVISKASDGSPGVTPNVKRTRSGDSTDTIWETAEGAAEDDKEEETRGTKEETVFRKLGLLVAKKWGAKGSEKRPTVTAEELQKHTSEEDFWVMINGMVFDIGPFLRDEAKHPGGKAILLTGTDAGDRFVRWHNAAGNAVRRAPEYFVGDLLGWTPPRRWRLCCCRRRSVKEDPL
eukprot:symbB.v1.2.029916.t1/scaffold3323.1/size59064/2